MIKLAIMLLSGGSAGMISYNLFPPLADKLFLSQEKRAKADTERMKDMFLIVKPHKLILIYIFLPVVLGLIGFMFLGNLLAAFIGIVAGLLLPNIVLKQLDANRKNKFNNQLIDALLLMSSSLKGGLSLVQTIDSVVVEMPAPISEEFSTVLNENKMGIALDESLAGLNKRMDSSELNLVVTAIILARETGGNLPEVFSSLVKSMREKKKISENVTTLTLQGRIQGTIMSILPIGFAAFVLSVNKEFFDVMLSTEIGKMLLVACVVLEVVGIFLIRKISRVNI